jgi:hypothetical protein
MTMNASNIIANAKLWFNRSKRTVDEREAYLSALDDLGVNIPTMDKVSAIFYPKL